MLAANLYKDYRTQHAVVHVIVVLCHCNVHPACVFLALTAGAVWMSESVWVWPVISTLSPNRTPQ